MSEQSTTTAQRSASYNFALAAAEMAANTRCRNVVVLDLRGKSPVTEFFVIATGTSPTQMRTAIDEVGDLGKRMNFKPWQKNGYDSAKWILIDFVQVVVHVFDVESRDFYDLELLWGDSPRINWRAELGLPAATEEELQDRTTTDLIEAEAEEARLEGDDISEEGDADMDEDADSDSPVIVELPNLSTGSNSVDFVEIDPPSKRRKRGRAVFPTPLEEPGGDEDAADITPVRKVSRDEDRRQRAATEARDNDPEAVSAEDLPEDRVETRPMGGVSANLSSTNIVETGEEDQQGARSLDDVEQDHRDERPEAHEEAAARTVIGRSTARKGQLQTRKQMKAPTESAPGPVNVKKAKAGVVKGKAKSPKKKASPKITAKTTAKKKPAAKKPAAAKAKKPAVKKVAKKAAAKKKPAAKKSKKK